MATTQENLKADALRVAERTLRQAASYAQLHATSKPLFQKIMRRPGSKPVMVRLDWPCVLTVFDPETGAVLAKSHYGNPTRLDQECTSDERRDCPSV